MKFEQVMMDRLSEGVTKCNPADAQKGIFREPSRTPNSQCPRCRHPAEDCGWRLGCFHRKMVWRGARVPLTEKDYRFKIFIDYQSVYTKRCQCGCTEFGTKEYRELSNWRGKDLIPIVQY
jgi:hypothetical protein